MILVYDNLLDQQEEDHIENFLRDPKFPWFLSIGYNHYTTDKKCMESNTNKDSQECVLLTHVFYLDSIKNSDNYHLSDFVLNKFLNKTDYAFKSLMRSKANLQLVSKSSNALYTTPHVDSSIDHKVLIYYVNDCDGDTFIFQKDDVERISPRKGRFVLFDGSYYHAAGLAKESDFRINLNFNLL